MAAPRERAYFGWSVTAAAALSAAVFFLAADKAATGIKALDGDSIRVRLAGGGETEVRLLGADCPEKGQVLADEARDFTSALTAGKHLELNGSARKEDRYGRTLAFVSSGGRDVSAELVEAGLAVAYIRPPDTRSADVYLAAQARAHAAGRGVWSGRKIEEPRSCRERKRGERSAAKFLAYENWTITGNSRTKVGHWPGCRHAEKIIPSNIIRFESVSAAKKAGYKMEGGYD